MPTLENTDFSKFYRNNDLDLSWIEKPGRHQFRWRLVNNNWITASRRFRDSEKLSETLSKQGARDVYIGTSSWLNPIQLPKKSDLESEPAVLLDHWIVFDIDRKPLTIKTLEEGRKIANSLLEYMEENHDHELISISFSGGKGFHLIFKDAKREKFLIEDLAKREQTVIEQRKALLDEVLEAGFDVDKLVTADTRRIIRLPGTLHGTTGWCCTRITRNMLSIPVKKWLHTLPRHEKAKDIPKKSNLWNVLQKLPSPSKSKDDADKTEKQLTSILEMQVSSQVVGVSNRSSFIAWLPNKLTEKEDNHLFSRMRELGWTPIYKFKNQKEDLIIVPRAINTPQLRNFFEKNSLQKYANKIKKLGHLWIPMVRASGSTKSEIHDIGVMEIFFEDEQSKLPMSATHNELISRLSDDVVTDEKEIGRREPAIRIVQIE